MTSSRIHRPLLVLALAAGTSCGDDGDTTGDGTGNDSSTSTDPTSTAPATTMTASGTASGSTSTTDDPTGSSEETGDCSPNPCGACEDGCTPTDECVAGEWQCGCECEGTDTGTSGTGDTTGTGGTTGTTGTTTGLNTACDPGMPAMDALDCAANGIFIEAPYDQWYTCYDHGEIPGVPKQWGGVVVDKDDPNKLLVGGNANQAVGDLYSVGIARDEDCHILGFEGPAGVSFSDAEYIDGGLWYHPNDVLFLSRWPVNEIGQLKPGNTLTDKVIDLDPLGIVSSPGGLTFVPPMINGEGQLKIVSWPGGQFYTLTISDDGNGTWDIDSAQLETSIIGGPEAFVYIAAGNPEFVVDGLLVAEWSAGNIAAYESDADGNPIPATRQDFITGLGGAESAYIDPSSGDFIFATFAGVDRLITVQGFMPQPQ